MSGRASKWWGRAYWALAAGLLPLVNPLLSLIVASALNAEWLGAVFLLVVANGLLLWLVARPAWSVDAGRYWRVFVGLALAVSLSVPLAVAELVIYLNAVCPDGGCFD